MNLTHISAGEEGVLQQVVQTKAVSHKDCPDTMLWGSQLGEKTQENQL